MAIATHVKNYLDAHDMPYQVVHHPYAETARECAREARIPPRRMAKGVLLEDDEGFLLAVVPADRNVDLDHLNQRFNRMLAPAGQQEVNRLFSDCARGAVPALGQAYNLAVVWDEEIAREPDCYLEGGSHEELIYLSRHAFTDLMHDFDHGRISC